MKSKGQRLVVIYTSWLTRFFSEGSTVNYKVLKGLPDDAVLLRSFQHDVLEELVLVFESDAWEELKAGDKIPRLELEMYDLRSVGLT